MTDVKDCLSNGWRENVLTNATPRDYLELHALIVFAAWVYCPWCGRKLIYE